MSNFLHIRKSGDTFAKLPKPYPAYAEAVAAGQALGGPHNFFVETSGVPTREEQLLLLPVTSRKRKQSSGRLALSAKERRLLDSFNL